MVALAIRELSLGLTRFDGVVANTGTPRDILTARLRKLEDQGVVRREKYTHRPPRYDYVLTDAGVALAPVLSALRRWGDEHVVDGEPPVRFVHSCGEPYVAEPTAKRAVTSPCPGASTSPTTMPTTAATASLGADPPGVRRAGGRF